MTLTLTLVLPEVVTGMSPSLSWGAAKAPVIRMDLHPNVQAAAAHVRRIYDLSLTYSDCARGYWKRLAEEAFSIGLQGTSSRSWKHRSEC